MPLTVLFSTAIRGFGVVANFLVALLLVKKFGREEAGVYFFLGAVFFFVAPIIRFGTDELILRKASLVGGADTCEVKSLYRISVSINIAVSAIVAILFFLSEIWIFRFGTLSAVPYLGSTVIIVLAASFYNFAYTLGKIAQGEGRFITSISIFSFLPNALILILIYFLPWAPSSISAVYFLLMACLVFLYSALVLGRNLKDFGFGSVSEAFAIRWSLVSICVSSTYSNGSLYLQTFIFNFFAPLNDLAVFSIMLRFASLFLLVISFVGHFFAPRLANAFWQNEFERLRTELLKGTALLALVNLIVFITLIIFRKFFLSIFDVEVSKWVIEYTILMLAYFLHGATGLLGTVLIMTGRERVVLWNTILAFSMTIIGMSTMGYFFGALGAIVAILLTVVVQKSVLLFFVHKLFFTSEGGGRGFDSSIR